MLAGVEVALREDDVSKGTRGPFLPAALRLAALDYKVFPCRPGDKAPRTSNGFKDASTDPEQIRKWWSETPNANVGVATEGILVLDIDVLDDRTREPNPWPGRERLLELEESAGAIASTPRGGTHFFFSDPKAEFRNTTSRIAHKVDTRAAGGYVVVSPSCTEHGEYSWECGLTLSVPCGQLPPPPQWLTDELRKLKSAPASERTLGPLAPGEKIKEGKRNDEMFRHGAKLRRLGLPQDEICGALRAKNRRDCIPPLDDPEIQEIAQSASRYAPSPQNEADEADFRLVGRPLGKFMLEESNTIPLIETQDGRALLVAGQMCIAAGASKSLKTSIVGGDLALSLATGTPFLGKFLVKSTKRVALLTGESGYDAIRDCFRRILKDREFTPDEQFDGLVVEDQLPRVAEPGHLEELTRFVTAGRFDVVICDPAYWMLASEKTESGAGNVFTMGAQLQRLRKAIPDGVTVILIHHFSKGAARAGSATGEPPTLEDMAQAGFAEFARQWLLIGRRTKYDGESGTHELWLNLGGSAGHSGLWGIDVREGKQSDQGGRKWSVEVLSREQIESQKEANKEARTASNERSLHARQREEVLSYVKKTGAATRTDVRNAVSMRSSTANAILDELIESGDLKPCAVVKSNRTYEGLQPATRSHPFPPVPGTGGEPVVPAPLKGAGTGTTGRPPDF